MEKYYRVTVRINNGNPEPFIISSSSEKKAKATLESFFNKLNEIHKNINTLELDSCRVFYINGNYYTKEELEDLK